MMATAVDTAYISAYTSVPEPTIQNLLDAPTVELVRNFLISLTAKAREHEALKGEKLRLEVELENAVRSGESKARSLKASLDKSLTEVEQLRNKLSEEENARAAVEFELQNLKNSSTSSVSEVQALQDRITILESSNRDLLSLLEAKSTAHDRLAEELSTQHQKIVSLRREVSTLEERNQATENALMTTKFREQTLQQEIQLSKKNNEWYETELKTRNAEYTKFRKEKGAKIAELQRINEDATSAIESAKRTESALRNRLDEVGQKADEAFAKIHQMQEEAAKTEEAFRVELDSAHRLAELQKQSADSARKRMQELQESLEQTKDGAADEIGQIQAELDTERSEKEAAENRIAELEIEVERLQSEVARVQQPPSVPGTPHRVNGVVNAGTPGRAGSPGIFTPGSTRAKGGLTFTQLYSEYTAAKAELEAARRENARLNAHLNEIMQDLEVRQPELEEVRLNNERLEADIAEVSSLLETAGQDRDSARKEARKWEGQVQTLVREGDLLRQQLRDLSAQVKILLVEVQARDQGLSAPDAAEQAQLHRAALGEYDGQSLEAMTDTGRFISQRLVLFRSVDELQEQNQKLIHLTRELGQRMEGEEAKAKQNQQENDRRELEELRERVERYQDEIKSMVTQSESFIRERDMFRRMLSHRAQLPSNTAEAASTFGQSVNGEVASETPRAGRSADLVNGSPNSRDMADYAKLLRDMQAHFDAYRQEAAIDHGALRQQVDRLAREKAELQGDVAKTSSQLTLAQERFDMLQANYNMLKTENTELNKRSQTLSETATKQDLRTQQVAEELIEAKGLADSMRNEIANLKAEKELWKKIEARLTEDNRLLMEERSRLNKVVTDLQTLQNERELSDSETRRRLQHQVEASESELQSTKRKLDKELEDSKNAALRREYEQEQHRTRIDDLVKSLGSIREELASAKTVRDQLEARVDELKIELRSAEERVQALQPKPTPRSDMSAAEKVSSSEDHVSREQELLIEVSELKRDLELTRGELENAQNHVEQYKAISQSAEEELQNLNQTLDQYHADMDRSVEEKDQKIRDLEQRVEDISSELSSRNTEISELRSKQEENMSRLDEQRTTYEAELSKLMDENERLTETIKFHQEDLKAQAEIAQQAQQSYENELVKHAEAAKSLQKVRSDYNQLRTEVAEYKAQIEALRTTLSQNEESWSETKGRYEQELIDLEKRRDDVKDQNKRLHEQLEAVSLQIGRLQRSRGSGTATEDSEGAPTSDMDNIQEVIKYLRREKEIVDVQYELSVNEAKRLKQQLDYCQTQLDETRLKLDQEHRRDVDRERNSLNHNKLMETINELNVFRESSITLRNEARQAQAQLAEKSNQVEDLLAQIQPLQTRVREMESELETKEGELRLLREDRDRWQQRTQTILQKYERIDPAELEALKERITSLERERDQLASEKAALQEQIDSIPEQIKKAQEEASKQASATTREKLGDQFKARSRELSAKINASKAEAQSANQAKEIAEKQLNAVRQELENARVVKDEALVRVEGLASQSQQRAKSADRELLNGVEDGQIEESEATGLSSAERKTLEDRIQSAEARASEQAERAAGLQREVESLHAKIAELEKQQIELQERLGVTSEELSALRSQLQQPQDNDALAHLEKLKQDLVTAQQEVATLRANASASALSADTTGNGAESGHASAVDQSAAIRAEYEAKYEERLQQSEQKYQTRVENMRKQLNTKLKEGKDAARQQLSKEYDEAAEKLKVDHESEIQRLNADHQREISHVKMEAEQQIEQAKQQSTAAAAPASVEKAGATEASEGSTKAEATKPQTDLSEAEARDLVAKNPTIKSIVRSNILEKVSQERETITAKVKEEQERVTAARLEEAHRECETAKEEARTRVREEQERTWTEKLEEARKKFETVKEQAVVLEGKKFQVKLSVAQTKERTALAKLQVVEKAANETPQRPVIEVWAIVQQTKAPPVQPATQAKPIVQPAPLAATTHNSAASNANVAATESPAQTAQQKLSNAQPPLPSPTQQRRASQQQGAPTSTQQPSSPSQQPQRQQQTTQQQQPRHQDPNSTLPARPPQSQNNAHQPTGTGPNALRGILSQSGIPRGGAMSRNADRYGRGGAAQAQNALSQAPALPQSGPQNQDQEQRQGQGMQIQGQAQAPQQGGPSNHPRGGGGQGGRNRGGQGRGGHHGQQGPAPAQGQFHIQGQAQNGAMGSPGAAGRVPMDPSAKQFIPGKRPREDSDGGGGNGGVGKRIRGGGRGGRGTPETGS